MPIYYTRMRDGLSILYIPLYEFVCDTDPFSDTKVIDSLLPPLPTQQNSFNKGCGGGVAFL